MFLYIIAFSILLAAVSGCGKNESLTDPVPSQTIQPTLASIQDNVFTPSCGIGSSCHGSGGAAGLDLRTGHAFNSLVNVRSENDGAHTPSWFRVAPGKPDSSFLITKLVGPSSSQGSIMPRIGGSLSPEAIAAIRTWIQNGAQP